MVDPLVGAPDAVEVNAIEGNASLLLELTVDADDVAAVRGKDNSVLQALQQVLAIAGGSRKAVLDLIDPDSESDVDDDDDDFIDDDDDDDFIDDDDEDDETEIEDAI
jgi:predicted RNA-binding protein YlqC (UPF0109 family)